MIFKWIMWIINVSTCKFSKIFYSIVFLTKKLQFCKDHDSRRYEGGSTLIYGFNITAKDEKNRDSAEV